MRMFDNYAIASPKMRKLVEEVAKSAKIPLQYGSGGGTTDGSVVQEFGALMMALGFPMRYTHSTTGVRQPEGHGQHVQAGRQALREDSRDAKKR